MNKPRKCDWCGETIEGYEDRVKLPVLWDGPAMTYHAKCYVQVCDEDCSSWLAELDSAPDTSPAPAPDPPSGATPDAAASAPQTPSGPPAFGGMTVDWFSPKIGRVELSEVGVLQALEDLDDEPRARVLTYAVARWFV